MDEKTPGRITPAGQHYVGVKQVYAYPEARGTERGYHVVYDKGTPGEYHSWSPADKFEAAYLGMGEDADGSKVSEAMVRGFIRHHQRSTAGEKTTVLSTTLVNGFEMVDSSSCVDKANYSEEVGAQICRDRARNQVWHLLGFALQWARHGIRKQ